MIFPETNEMDDRTNENQVRLECVSTIDFQSISNILTNHARKTPVLFRDKKQGMVLFGLFSDYLQTDKCFFVTVKRAQKNR